ncbi:hypothetical protein McanMca71_003902 [Microsporum canis]|uniref:HNH nuclease domain-containing protein n=1 Tax=Arthroderma otae (strain ATCC MYA-4605 / CBS 113480) TaxID=554155 RepID=C5FV16_ARTOC|nr:conserved hypothetical protein [Microsporum canis CBS 113480]EEQ33750.1 conserved hypothetical protein [Microsporum canis CBS 113480]
MASHHHRQPSYEGIIDIPGLSHVPPQPHHRHQASLEGIINYSSLAPLSADERSRAQGVLDRIINRLASHSHVNHGYSCHLLVRHSYDYSLSELSKDTFLRVFFNFMELEISSDEDIDTDDDHIPPKFIQFADMLIEKFFFPLRASGMTTPQPTPAQLSATRSARSLHDITGTSERVSYLRALCLVRDHHRCVISRVFDAQQAIVRMTQYGLNAQDDDGNLIIDGDRGEVLDVAHILPHSLTKVDENLQLSDSRRIAIDILNMFDCDVAQIIDGPRIDSPCNAITLSHTWHNHFGNFDVYFDAIPGEEHTYRINGFFNPAVGAYWGLPVTRKLFLSEERVVDAPSPRLLALHRAIAHILHLSGAGEYINRILRDFAETGVQADGSTDIGRIVNLRLSGWRASAVKVY